MSFEQTLFLEFGLKLSLKTGLIEEKIDQFWPRSFTVLFVRYNDFVRVRLITQFRQAVNQ